MQVKLTWSFINLPSDQAPQTFRIFHKTATGTYPTTPHTTVTVAEVCSGTNCAYTYSANTLSFNTAYTFRIDTTCINGNPAPSQEITLLHVLCPTVTAVVTDKSIGYSFTGAPNTSVTGYRIQLFEVNPNNTLLEIEDLGIVPVTATVSGTFSSELEPLTNYRIRITVKSNGGADKVCETDTTTTSDTSSCTGPKNLFGCVCEVDCAEPCALD